MSDDETWLCCCACIDLQPGFAGLDYGCRLLEWLMVACFCHLQLFDCCTTIVELGVVDMRIVGMDGCLTISASCVLSQIAMKTI